jgi:hypothetical protein
VSRSRTQPCSLPSSPSLPRGNALKPGFCPDAMAPGPYLSPSHAACALRLVRFFLQKRPCALSVCDQLVVCCYYKLIKFFRFRNVDPLLLLQSSSEIRNNLSHTNKKFFIFSDEFV